MLLHHYYYQHFNVVLLNPPLSSMRTQQMIEEGEEVSQRDKARSWWRRGSEEEAVEVAELEHGHCDEGQAGDERRQARSGMWQRLALLLRLLQGVAHLRAKHKQSVSQSGPYFFDKQMRHLLLQRVDSVALRALDSGKHAEPAHRGCKWVTLSSWLRGADGPYLTVPASGWNE